MNGGEKKHKCQVCQTFFKNGGPEPHLLPCLHSVCSTCLTSDITDVITCSICQDTFIKSKKSTDFPKDAVRAKDILLSSVQRDSSDMLCTNRPDGNKARSWCHQCEAFLCEVCEECHKAMKFSRKHSVLSLATFIKSEKGISTSAVHCEDHDNYPLELFDETCKILLCYKCLKTNHSKCCAEDMNTTFETFKTFKLNEGAQGLMKKLDHISEVESKVHSLSSQLDSKILEVKRKVKETFNDLHTALTEREEHLLFQLGSCFKELQDNNVERLAILDEEKARCKDVLKFTDKCGRLSGPVDLLKMRKAIEGRTETCLGSDLPVVREKEACVSFGQSEVQDLKEFIATFGEYFTNISGMTSDEPLNIGRIALLKLLNSTYKAEIDRQEGQLNNYAEKLNKIARLVEESRDVGTINFTTDLDFAVNKYVYSDEVFIKNISWVTGIQKTSDSSRPGEYLGIYVYCQHSREGQWSCEVSLRIKILREQGTGESRTFAYTYTQKKNGGIGYPQFISIKELEEPGNGYMKDGTDKIEIETEITVTKTHGISGLKELIKEECSLE